MEHLEVCKKKINCLGTFTAEYICRIHHYAMKHARQETMLTDKGRLHLLERARFCLKLNEL